MFLEINSSGFTLVTFQKAGCVKNTSKNIIQNNKLTSATFCKKYNKKCNV